MIMQLRHYSKILFSALLLMSAIVLVLSQGKTEIVLITFYAIAVALAAYGLSAGIKFRPIMTVYALLFVVFGAIIIGVVGYMIGMGMIGFTGRTSLWEWYIHDLGSDLLFGKGGLTMPADPAFSLKASQMGMPPTPDSSYVMMMYNNGVIGIIIYLVSLAMMWRKAAMVVSLKSFQFIMILSCYIIFAFFESGARLALPPS